MGIFIRIVMTVVSVVLLLAVMTVAKATRESVEHGAASKHGKQEHTLEGHHNVHFDHEAILGSYKLEQEFDELPAEEAKRRLGLLVMKMDKNGDHFVSREELIEWIVMSFRLLDEEEALEDFEEKDTDDDDKLTWTEFLQNHFGYSEQEYETMKTENKDDVTTFLEEVEDERKKFVAADTNKDDALDKSEYVAFYSPFNYEHMHHIELERTMHTHDKDKDGALSLDEFIGNSQHDKEWEIVERERFEEFDVDKDRLLNLQELRPWVLADTREEAEEEAEHLIQEADADKDGKLSEEEIVDAHEEFVGSQVTDYGRHLHFVKHRDEL